MKLLIDSHVHIYPLYDAERALRSAIANVEDELGDDASLTLLLTERSDCDAFSELKQRRVLGARETSEAEALTLSVEERAVTVVSGRQIVTAERIEVLALGTGVRFSDGEPVRETLETVIASGALCVLPWSPGKWWGKRGATVTALLDEYPPTAFCLGDIPMRAYGWREPAQFHRARSQGRAILAGSDPLPFSGEEDMVGRYVTEVEGEWSSERPWSSVRQAISAPAVTYRRVGRRCSFSEMIWRTVNNARARRASL